MRRDPSWAAWGEPGNPSPSEPPWLLSAASGLGLLLRQSDGFQRFQGRELHRTRCSHRTRSFPNTLLRRRTEKGELRECIQWGRSGGGWELRAQMREGTRVSRDRSENHGAQTNCTTSKFCQDPGEGFLAQPFWTFPSRPLPPSVAVPASTSPSSSHSPPPATPPSPASYQN